MTGTRAEARCLRGLPVSVACSGADSARARHEAARLVAEGAAALLSFGLAAGLVPALRAGDLILADGVVLPDGGHVTPDPTWRGSVAAEAEGRGVSLRFGAVAGTDRVLATPQAKRALHEATSALAADMESHAVAEAAAGSGLPFLVLRAISDRADQPLPPALLAAVGADGRLRAGRAVTALMRRPGEIPAALRLARGTRAALVSLGRAVAALDCGSGSPGCGIRAR